MGLKYFSSLISNGVKRREMIRILKNTLGMSAIGILTSYLPMFVAIFINEIPFNRYKKLAQTLITIPNFVGWVIVYAAFFNLFAPSGGLVSRLLREWHLIEGNFELMTSAEWGWAFMWILSNWKALGWSSIIYLSAISSIDQELYEAAGIDGAGRFQKMWYITIPSLMPTFVTLLVLSIGSILGSDFEKHLLFSNAFNRSTVETIDLYVYNVGIGTAAYSYTTAVGLLKSIVGLSLMFFANAISKKVRGTSLF